MYVHKKRYREKQIEGERHTKRESVCKREG